MRPDAGGRLIQSFLASHPRLSLLNTRAPTMVASNPISAPDLTFVTANWASSSHWAPGPAYASDHYPITISLRFPPHLLTSPSSPPPKWNYSTADWRLFSTTLSAVTWPVIRDVNDAVTFLTSNILDAATVAIPRSFPTAAKLPKCAWWNESCARAHTIRNQALRRFQRSRTASSRITLHKAQATMNKVVRSAKRHSWNKVCASLTSSSTLTVLWKSYRSITGKNPSQSRVPPIQDAQGRILSPPETLQAFYSHYSALYGAHPAPPPTVAPGAPHAEMDAPFTLDELQTAIHKTKSPTPGPDGVSGHMIRHLPLSAQHYLLEILNHAWLTQAFPESWKSGHTLLFPKPKTDPSDIRNYRPITLLDQLAKLWERIISVRLTWWLARTNFWAPSHHGGIPGRGPLSAHATLLNFIHAASSDNKHTAFLFLDIQRAYDTISHTAVFQAIAEAHLPPLLYHWIHNYLPRRTIQLRMGNAFSPQILLRNGIPQGAVLSPLLYNMATNDLHRSLTAPFMLQYIDDVCIGTIGDTLLEARDTLQSQTPLLQCWTDRRNLTINHRKTHTIGFRPGSRTAPSFTISIAQSSVHSAPAITYLGLQYEHHLRWTAQISRLIQQAHRVSSFVRTCTRPRTEILRTHLLRIYQVMLLSHLRYATICIVEAKPTVLLKLDRVIHATVRACLGVPRSTNLNALYVEASSIPPYLTREKLLLKAQYRLHFSPFYRSHSFNLPLTRDTHSTSQPMIRQIHLYHRLYASHDDVTTYPSDVPSHPPWTQVPISLTADLPFRKHDSSDYNQSLLNHWLHSIHPAEVLYTDASLDATQTAYAGWCSSLSHDSSVVQLPTRTTIYTAEYYGLHMAVASISLNLPPCTVVICSDALSVLLNLASSTCSHHQDRWHVIRTNLSLLYRHNITVHFLWLPSHSAIAGNDRIDHLVSSIRPHRKPSITFTVPELLLRVPIVITDFLQTLWLSSTTPLRHFHPTATVPIPCLPLPFHLQRFLTLARIGRLHTRELLHRWCSTNSNSCTHCLHVPQTLEHILLDCPVTAPAVSKTLPCHSLQWTRNTLLTRLLGLGPPSQLLPLPSYLQVIQVLRTIHNHNSASLHVYR